MRQNGRSTQPTIDWSALAHSGFLSLADLRHCYCASRSCSADVYSPLWRAACERYGIHIECPAARPGLLVDAARVAKGLPGEEWFLKSENELQDFVDKGLEVLRSSSADIGSGARFSFELHGFDEGVCDSAGLRDRLRALANGDVFCHVPIRVRLSEEEKQPRQHWTSHADILPPCWADDPEQAEICIGLDVDLTRVDGAAHSASLRLSASLFRCDGGGIVSNTLTGESRWYEEAPTESHISRRGFRLALLDVGNGIDACTVRCDSSERLWHCTSLDDSGTFVMPKHIVSLFDRLVSGTGCRCILGQVTPVS